MATHERVAVALTASGRSWYIQRSYQSSFIHVVVGNESYVNRSVLGTQRHKERWDINPRSQAHLQSQLARWSCTKQGQTATSKALSSVPQMAKWQSNLKGPIHSPYHSFIHSPIHSSTHSVTHSLIHSLIHSLTNSFIHAFIYSFTHIFTISFIH